MSSGPAHRACWAAALIGLWMCSASASDLVQVYEAATLHNAQLRSAAASLRSAIPRAAQAEALLRPSVNASVSKMLNRTYPSEANDTLALALALRPPLFDAQAVADVAKARTALEDAKLDWDLTTQKFILQVAQAYFDVLAAQDILAAARANKASLADQLWAAQRRFEAGTGIVTDVQDSQARFDLAVYQELAAETDARVLRRALSRLAGQSDVSPSPLAQPVHLPPMDPDNVQSWMVTAEHHPSIARSRLAAELARLDADRAKAARLPTVHVIGNIGRLRNSGFGAQNSVSVGLELNLNLFSGLQSDNRIAETVILLEKANEDLEAARTAVAEATERAFFNVKSGAAQVNALEAAEVSSRGALQGAVAGFRAGVRLNLDVLNAQTVLFQTQRDLAKARYDVLLGYLRLRQAAGVLGPEHLSAINALVLQ